MERVEFISLEELEAKRDAVSSIVESQKNRLNRIGTGKHKEGQSWEYDIKIAETRVFARESIKKSEAKLAGLEQTIQHLQVEDEAGLIEEAQRFTLEIDASNAKYVRLKELFEKGNVKKPIFESYAFQWAELQQKPLHDKSLARGLHLLKLKKEEEAKKEQGSRALVPAESIQPDQNEKQTQKNTVIVNKNGTPVPLAIDVDKMEISVDNKVRRVNSKLYITLLNNLINSPTHSLTSEEAQEIADDIGSNTTIYKVIQNLNRFLNDNLLTSGDTGIIKAEKSKHNKNARYYLNLLEETHPVQENEQAITFTDVEITSVSHEYQEDDGEGQIMLPNGSSITISGEKQQKYVRILLATHESKIPVSTKEIAELLYGEYEIKLSSWRIKTNKRRIAPKLAEHGYQIKNLNEGKRIEALYLLEELNADDQTFGFNNQSEQSEPIETSNEESSTESGVLSKEELASIGSLIITRDNTKVFTNGSSFDFILSDEMKNICNVLMDRLGRNRVNNDTELMIHRKEGLTKLQSILSSASIEEVIDSIDSSNEDVKKLLIWLYFTNEEEMHGQMMEFLSSDLKQSIKTSRGYVVESVTREWHSVRQATNGKTQQKESDSEEKQVDDDLVEPQKEIRQVETEVFDAAEVYVFDTSLSPEEEFAQKTAAILKRNPNIRAEIDAAIKKVEGLVKMEVATAYQISGALKIHISIVNKIINALDLKVFGYRNGRPQYDQVGIALIKYLSKSDTTHLNFTKKEIESLKHLTIAAYDDMSEDKA